ncbi:MAG: NTP transferase domain-containing protein [Paludibacteraceae bacterium]|nr:NTP transferase domain-containing protein [Paludibacteraceae bacterium]
MLENKNNYCVIMAGGVGSRFWPFSRESKPKQFLDFFGTGRSLLQMTVDRFRPIIPIENMVIVTNVAYRDMILEQIPDMKAEQILCEPARRNTAPCIAYATAWIKSRVKSQESRVKTNIVVAASDHLILEEEKFRQVILKAFEFVGKNEAICTLGMQPTRPETGYGYIQFVADKSDELKVESLKLKVDGIFPVKQFKEKPNLETAKKYLESGDYLWNSGIFIWSLDTICKAIETYLPEVAAIFAKSEGLIGTDKEADFIGEYFPKCPNISVDYGILEKADNVFVIPSSFGWSDLGTWGSLYELSEKDEQGNVSLHSETHYYEAQGNIVVLEPGKVAIVQGVNDMIIVEEKGALLVCKKSEEQRIKQFVNELTIDN